MNDENYFCASKLLESVNNAVRANSQYSYSLEPGGQLEWASGPSTSLWEIKDQFDENTLIQEELCKSNGIDIGYFSVEPVSTPFDIRLIDSEKYRLMNDLFIKTGDLGPWMMRNTTSIQLI